MTFKHGHNKRNSPIYRTWACMIERCRNPRAHNYHRYGGRGIAVCDRWHEFINFLEDMAEGWAPGLTLDRRENSGHYEPGNCRWATPVEQAANRRARQPWRDPRQAAFDF